MLEMYSTAANLSTDSTLFVKKICHASDIEKISFIVLENNHVQVSAKAKILISLFISVSKMGYTEINVSIGKLISILKSRIGQSISERSMFRYLSEVESKSIIHRKKYRVGKDRFNTQIQLSEDFFSFWSKRKSHNVTPIPTQDHRHSQLPKRQESARTKDNIRVNQDNHRCSSSSEKNVYNRPRARASDQYTGKRKRENPLIYSVRYSCKGRRDARFLIARAKWELNCGREIPGHSGVDWNYWSQRWQSFGNGTKDSVMRGQILPLLANPSNLNEKKLDPLSLLGVEQIGSLQTERQGGTYKQESPLTGIIGTVDMSPEEIRCAVREISRPKDEISSKSTDGPEFETKESSLSSEEFSVLREAALRAKARVQVQ